MAKIKGVFKTFKNTSNGRRYYHYAFKGGPQFWIGGRDDDDQTPGYREAHEVATGVRNKPAPPSVPGHETVADMERAWKSSREWKGLSPRTQADYERGLKDFIPKYGAQPARLFFNDPDASELVLVWIEGTWSGREADYRLDAVKCLASWLSTRKKAAYPRSQFKGIKKFYKSPGRADKVWTDDEVSACAGALRQNLADAVVSGRDIGARVGDLVKLGRPHLRDRDDGRKVAIFFTNKGARFGRVANVILTQRVEGIIERMAPGQQTLLAKANGEPWDAKELAKEVMEAVRQKKLVRPELRFNDLRGSKATELVWTPGTSIGDVALQMGWSQETAARMIGVYAALNPNALKAPAESATPN